MKTTLDLPEDLLDEAMRLSHKETMTDVVVAALEELVHRIRILGLKDFKGKVDLDIDLSALRERK